MTPIYLSPEHPRWEPRTEDDLQAAIHGGLIEESNRLEVKRPLELKSKSANKELARDLAMFAPDGGTVIIGIAEDKPTSTFKLEPQALDGLAERVESIARTIPDPPLNVITAPIPATGKEGIGYLVVHVPASPAAPHMVDGKYPARGHKTKHYLTDAEVARLHERRRNAEQDVLNILHSDIDADPLPGVGEQSRLFLVAEPMTGRRDMLLDLTAAPDWNLRLARFVDRAHTRELNLLLRGCDVLPDFTYAGNGFRRGRGVARATRNIGSGRVYTPEKGTHHEDDALELQVFENGGLRLYFSRLSDHGGDGIQRIFDNAAVGLTRRFLALVTAAADEAGYLGNWGLAVGATNLRGRPAFERQAEFGSSRSRYDQDSYEEATGVSWADLNAEPGAITRRLVGPLLRGLGVEHRHTEVFKD